MMSSPENLIKVLYILPSLERGGTERQVVETVVRHNRRIFKPYVACLVSGGPLEEELHKAGVQVDIFNFNIHHFTRNFPSNSYHYTKLFSYIKALRPHIVYAFIYSPVILAVPAARLAGVPLVLSGWQNTYYAWMDHFYLRLLERVVNRYAHYIIANSRAVMKEVLLFNKTSRDNVLVIYNGCDCNKFYPRESIRAEKRKELGIGENDFVVGVLSNLYRTKGQEYLIQALPWLLGIRKDIKVMLVGRDRGYETYLRNICRNLKVEDKVAFTGERADIPELLNTMDIGVNSSLCEGFCNAILEMMASGLPVVATEVGGNPEAVVHGKTGLIVSPGDSAAIACAIAELLHNPSMVSVMGKAARERVENKFSVEQMIEKQEETYIELLKKVNANVPSH